MKKNNKSCELTLSKETSLFLRPRTPAKYRTSSVFASPSTGGAFICTPTPSEEISKTLNSDSDFIINKGATLHNLQALLNFFI